MDGDRARRTVSMVMVYAFASARQRLFDLGRRREFLVRLVERLSRKHDIAAPDRAACTRSQEVLTALGSKLDAAVRAAGDAD